MAILLCCVLLYQAGGFAWRLLAMESYEDLGSLSGAKEVVVKIPLALPYHSDWEQAQAVRGQVRDGDQFYQMKEQRVQSDTLYTTLELDQTARDRFVDLANDFNSFIGEGGSDLPPTKTQLLPLLLKDFCQFTRPWVIYVLEWLPEYQAISYHLSIPNSPLSSLDLPPKIA